MSDTTKGAIYAAIIGAVATIIAALLNWIHIGPEPDDLRFPVAVFDNVTKGAIPDAEISLDIPDLSSAMSDSGGKHTFKLTKRLVGKSATLTVRKEGFQLSTEQIMSLQPQDDFHKVYLIHPPAPVAVTPPPPERPVEVTRVYPSGQKASGSGSNFSDWYRVCSTEEPGYRVRDVTFNLSGDRVCNAWSECKEENRSASQVCWRFRLQGHNEWPAPGQANSEGFLTVVWTRAS